MKECNKVFFGEKGITSTSANHLANLAKETIESNKTILNHMNFVNVSVSLLGGAVIGTNIQEGRNDAFVANIPSLLAEMSEMNAFCAWMREAIKAKEKELEDLEDLTSKDYATLMGIEYPVISERPQPVTKFDILGTMSVAERMEYYRLEATAATIGQCIHPNQPFAKAREVLMLRTIAPNFIKGEGVNTMIYSYSASANSDKVEEMFMRLQQEHRDNEARLNKLKYGIQSAVDTGNSKLNTEHSNAVSEELLAIKEINSKCAVYKDEEKKKLLALKIVIPRELAPTYDKLMKLVSDKQV